MKAKKTDKLKAIALATYLKARGRNLRRVYGWTSLMFNFTTCLKGE